MPGQSREILARNNNSASSSDTGLFSNQGEKSIDFYFIKVPLRKSIQVWYSKAQDINTTQTHPTQATRTVAIIAASYNNLQNRLPFRTLVCSLFFHQGCET